MRLAAYVVLLVMAVAGALAPTIASAPSAFAPSAFADEPPRVTGRFLLTDHDGRPVADDTYRGRVRVMTFGYTWCPDICPTTLATLSAARDALGPDVERVAFLFVTVDPERDTPEHLKGWMSAFPGITGLTGTRAMVDSAARNFRVRFQANRPEGTDPAAYSVDHSAGIFVMGRDGGFVAKLGHMSTGDEVAARIREALR